MKKNQKTKKDSKSIFDVLVLVAAIIFSLGIIRWSTFTISAGSAYGPPMLPAQIIDSDGVVKQLDYGFPLTYKDKTTVTAKDPYAAGFAEYSYEEQRMSYAYPVLNVIFWYGLLFTIKSAIQFYRNI